MGWLKVLMCLSQMRSYYLRYSDKDRRLTFTKKRRIDDDEYKRLLFEFSYPEVAEILNKDGKTYPILDKDGQIIN